MSIHGWFRFASMGVLLLRLVYQPRLDKETGMAAKKAKKAGSNTNPNPGRGRNALFQDAYSAGSAARSQAMGKSPSASTRSASASNRLSKKYDEWAPKSPANQIFDAGYRKGAGRKTGRGKKGVR